MTFWSNFWAVVLVVGLILFAALAVVVSVGALFDIRSLFRSIRAQHDKQDR